MAGRKKKTAAKKQVETLVHADEKRKNIPTAEFQAVVEKEQNDPLRIAAGRGASVSEVNRPPNRTLLPESRAQKSSVREISPHGAEEAEKFIHFLSVKD